MQSSAWPHFDLLFVHEGHLDMQVEKRGQLTLTAGEGILLFPNTPFSPYGNRSEARASVQHFSLVEHSGLPAPLDVLASQETGSLTRTGPRNPQLEADIARSMELAVAENTPMLHLMREALLTLILGEFLQTTLPDPTRNRDTTALIQWVKQQPVRNLTVSKMARAANVTPSGLRRRFVNELKMSPQQFLLNLRMNESARLLRETTVPIKQIALRVGYGSATAFHNAFLKARSETPGGYRKGHRPLG